MYIHSDDDLPSSSPNGCVEPCRCNAIRIRKHPHSWLSRTPCGEHLGSTVVALPISDKNFQIQVACVLLRNIIKESINMTDFVAAWTNDADNHHSTCLASVAATGSRLQKLS